MTNKIQVLIINPQIDYGLNNTDGLNQIKYLFNKFDLLAKNTEKKEFEYDNEKKRIKILTSKVPNLLRLTDEDMVNTFSIGNLDGHHYEMVYVKEYQFAKKIKETMKKENKKETSIKISEINSKIPESNIFGCLLTNYSESIHGKIAVIKSVIEKNWTTSNTNINIIDLKRILESKIQFKVVALIPGNNLNEKSEISVETDNLAKIEKYLSSSIGFSPKFETSRVILLGNNPKYLAEHAYKLRMISVVITDSNKDKFKFNKLATRLTRRKIMGPIALYFEDDDGIRYDLSYSELIKLQKIYSQPLDSIKLSKWDLSKNLQEDKYKLKYICPQYFLDKYYANCNLLCYSCKKSLEENNGKACAACYGILYCSKECQTKDWVNHKNKCIEFSKKDYLKKLLIKKINMKICSTILKYAKL